MNKKPVDYYDRIADALQILTGDDSNVDAESPTMDYYDRIANALETLAKNGNSNSSLPTVTSNDNGDVLTVVEGAWAKAAPAGGVLVVTDFEGTLDRTWQEIHDAPICVVKFTGDNDGDTLTNVYMAVEFRSGQDGYSLAFAGMENASNEHVFYKALSADGYPTTYVPEG